MDDFGKILPPAITEKATRTPAGNEWVLPLPEANQSIHLATTNRIAILGVEAVRILDDGLGVENCSGYELSDVGDWTAYVHRNNEAALRFIDDNSVGHGRGYILTAVSKSEFKALRR